MKKNPIIILLSLILVISAGLLAYLYLGSNTQNEINTEAFDQAYLAGNKEEALIEARKIMNANPDDSHLKLRVANLIEDKKSDEAKDLFKKVYEKYKQENNADDEEALTVISLNALATLAEDAGLKEEAIYYYEKVIERADNGFEDEPAMASEAQKALDRLRQ
jgi:tetratricopeptide (TPR) repeat protein